MVVEAGFVVEAGSVFVVVVEAGFVVEAGSVFVVVFVEVEVFVVEDEDAAAVPVAAGMTSV